ncbi:hypothetical protein PLESTM_000447300 [Pleodorina starrii]|nr:hypothetical protein PLESTM_000447300 [Pleodorina starrii]
MAALGLRPMLVNFTANPLLCEPGAIHVCGTFYSEHDARQLEPWMRLQAGFWLRYLAGDCNAVTAGYNFRIQSNPKDCLDVDAGWTCAPENTTFPPCKCEHGKYKTPFFVNRAVTEQPGRTNQTTLYCFGTRVAKWNYAFVADGPCADSKTLRKAEIFADYSLRKQVRGFRLTPSGGVPRWAATSWGPRHANQLKATTLNWGMSEADGGEICIEVKNPTTLKDLCLGDSPNTW